MIRSWSSPRLPWSCATCRTPEHLMNFGAVTVWPREPPCNRDGIYGILGGTFPPSCAPGTVSGGGGLAYTILRKLAKAAVAASYDAFCFSDGLRRGGSVTKIERDRTLAVSLRPGLALARCVSLQANRGRLPTICLFVPNAPSATLTGWLATSCFSWDFWLRR